MGKLLRAWRVLLQRRDKAALLLMMKMMVMMMLGVDKFLSSMHVHSISSLPAAPSKLSTNSGGQVKELIYLFLCKLTTKTLVYIAIVSSPTTIFMKLYSCYDASKVIGHA